jgi:hypothetical protein
MFLSESTDNIFYENNIYNNVRGLEIRTSSNNNAIYHNNFINNQEDNALDECSNDWDNGYPSGGNFWDDYTGTDTNGDGIGDISYSIPGGSNQDNYPFMNQFGWNHPPHQPTDPNPQNGSINVDINAILYWTGGDPNPYDTVSYDIFFGTNDNPPQVAHNLSYHYYNPGGMSQGIHYYWKIISWDNHGVSTHGPLWSFTTTSDANSPPFQPTQPLGPQIGYINTNYEYVTTTTDPDNDNITYGWDWDGDFVIDEWSEWFSSGQNCSVSHNWDIPDTYNISVKAKDIHFGESEWSSPLSVTIINRPPNTPTINGPTSGIIGIEYKYHINATDIDGNDIQYFIDWGDNHTGWTNYYSSNEIITVQHTWEEKGTYHIKLKAKDIFDAESDWEILEVTMPKNMQLIKTIFYNYRVNLPMNFYDNYFLFNKTYMV